MGLFHAHQLMWLQNGRARFDLVTTIANFLQAWNGEISTHFNSEEVILVPLHVSASSKSRLLAEHRDVRQKSTELFAAASPSIDLCYSVGSALEQHIRWEEHEFFPEIEAALNDTELAALAAETKQMEDSRPKGCSL